MKKREGRESFWRLGKLTGPGSGTMRDRTRCFVMLAPPRKTWVSDTAWKRGYRGTEASSLKQSNIMKRPY